MRAAAWVGIEWEKGWGQGDPLFESPLMPKGQEVEEALGHQCQMCCFKSSGAETKSDTSQRKVTHRYPQVPIPTPATTQVTCLSLTTNII